MAATSKSKTRIIGIDPGTNFLGYAVIEIIGREIKLLECDVLAINKGLDSQGKLAAIFPRSFHFSPDIAVHQNKQRHSVLEVNAFGDYIRHCQVNGMNTYEWELEQWSRRNASEAIHD